MLKKSLIYYTNDTEPNRSSYNSLFSVYLQVSSVYICLYLLKNNKIQFFHTSYPVLYVHTVY